MEKIENILNYTFHYNEDVGISVKSILMLILLLVVTSFLLKKIKKVIVNRLNQDDKNKFRTVFSFGSWLIYIIIFLTSLHASGVDVTAIFAASAALLIGIGLALQTFFQDIISGIFIIVDKSVQVGDVIELDGKIGRVVEIKLRTTRVLTIQNKIIVIPNHLYLTHSLYNWTQNNEHTRENISVRVPYETDVDLVKTLLVQAVKSHSSVLSNPAPTVIITNFGEDSFIFEVIFTLKDCFWLKIRQGEIRLEIEKLFRENGIKFPHPQRDIHIIDKNVVK